MVAMTPSILDQIVAVTRADLAERKARVPLEEMRAQAALAPAATTLLLMRCVHSQAVLRG